MYLDIAVTLGDTIAQYGTSMRILVPDMVVVFVRGPNRKWMIVQ